MANQINVSIPRQPFEPFEALDSEAGSQNTDASLAGDSADANTGGNPDIVNPHIEGESVNPVPLTTVVGNNLLNRYGIGDGIIIQRPAYALNNHAAPAAIPAPLQQPESAQVDPAQPDLASSGLETVVPINSKPPEKQPVSTTSSAKDATSTPAPVTLRGTKLPPRDSAAFTAAREYGAQHGSADWEVDQVAVILAYYHCETAQQCKDILSSLPFHITSIMQAIGWNSEGVYDVGFAMRNMQEAQIAMSGDPSAANRLNDDRVARMNGGGARIERAGAGQGGEDYAIEMSMSSGAGDIAALDFSDDYADPYGADYNDTGANTSQPDLEPLPLLPPVDANGPMMLPPPNVQVEHEMAAIPTIGVTDQGASQLAPESDTRRATIEIGEIRLVPSAENPPVLSSDPEQHPNFMGYNRDGQPLYADPATERYAPSGISEFGYRLTGLSTATEGSVLGFDATGTPYSGVRNAAGEMRWYALGFAEASSIMSARANGAFAELGSFGLARGAVGSIGSAGMALFTMAMPGNAGRDTNITNLADGSRFVVGAGAFEGRLEVRDADGNWTTVPGRARLDYSTGTPFAILNDDERRNRGLPPSLIPPPNPGSGLLTNPGLTDDERNWLNGTTISPIPPNNLPPLGGFQIAPPQTIGDLIIESRQRAEAAWQANPDLRAPQSLVGQSEGGPGDWGYSPTRTGGEQYQEQITNAPRGVEYNVNGVWFDGYDPATNTLLDSKDWGGFVLPGTPFWDNQALGEARRQINAAAGTGARIEWDVTTQQAADALRTLFDNAADQDSRYEDLRDIIIRVVPKK